MIPRKAIAGLSLSAAALIGLVMSENYTDRAVIPTKNDRPTVGFGSTFYADGRPVKMGDTITPVRALITAQAHISKEERVFRESLSGVELHQGEYDTFLDWTYQYGSGAWMRSGMRRKLLASDYKGACNALLTYRFSGGYDCSTLIDGKPNKRCWGVWIRQQERHAACMALQ